MTHQAEVQNNMDAGVTRPSLKTSDKDALGIDCPKETMCTTGSTSSIDKPKDRDIDSSVEQYSNLGTCSPARRFCP